MTEATFDVVKGFIGRRPASAVLSMRVPDESSRSDVTGNFCNVVHLFATRDAAERWIGARKDIIILSPEGDSRWDGDRRSAGGPLALAVTIPHVITELVGSRRRPPAARS